MIDYEKMFAETLGRKTARAVHSEVEKYASSYNSLNNDYKQSMSSKDFSTYDSDYKNKYDRLSVSINENKKKAESLLKMLETFKGAFGENYNDVKSAAEDSYTSLNDMSENIENYNSFYSQFENEEHFRDYSMHKKYEGKAVSDIDTALSAFDSIYGSRSADDDYEYNWLKNNRDTFMSTNELLDEIKKLEGASTSKKSDKIKSLAEFVRTGLSGQNADSAYSTYKSSSAASTENQARLQKLYKLLSDREDFDVEGAYREADKKNIFDVFSPDYSMADYRNDQTKKNVYGAESIVREDERNLKTIADNQAEFDADYNAISSIINQKQLASDIAGTSFGGSVINMLFPEQQKKTIISTSPEIQKIIKKWESKGYDFKSLLDTFERQSNKQYTQDIQKQAAEFTKKHPVAGNISSVAGSLVGNIAATGDVLSDIDEILISDDYTAIDINSPAWALKNATDEIRETTSQMIVDKAETDFGGEVGNFLYQTGMSLADMGASYLAGGFNPAAYAMIMSSTVATDKIKSVTKNGGSVDEALLSGIVAGALEAVFEKIGIDNLVGAITKGSGKSVLKTFLSSALSEGLEELGTDISNSIADAIINGDNSEFNNAVYTYMDAGYSASAAQAAALTDLAKQFGLSFAGGALSGGIIGGVGGSINKNVYNNTLREVGQQVNSSGNAAEFIDYAKNFGIDTGKAEKLYGKSSFEAQLKKLAEESVIAEQEAIAATDEKYNNNAVNTAMAQTAEKLGLRQKIADRRSNLEVGKLFEMLNSGVNEKINSSVANIAEEILTETGMDNQYATEYAQLISKAVEGTITEREHKILAKNQTAMRILDDITAANSEIHRAMLNQNFTGLSDNAVRYFEALAPALTEGADLNSFTVKKELPKTAEVQKNNQNEKIAEPTIPAITADADTVLEARESVKNIYGDAGARTVEYLVKRIDGNEDVIRNLFDEYYVAGSLGETDINNVTQRTGITLAPEIQQEVKNQAFAAGISDYYVSSQSARGTNAVHKGSVTVSKSVSTQISDEEKSFLDLFARTLGVEINIVPEIFASGKKAEGKYSDGKLYLSEDVFKGDLWASIFSHELGHHLSETAPEQWRNYKKFVIENMRSNPQRYASILAKKKIEYRQVQNNILDMEIMDEIACDCLELFLYDAKFTSEMIERDRSFVEKVRDWLKNFIAQLSEAIHSFNNKQSAHVLNSVMQQRDNYAEGLALVNSLLEQGAKTVDHAMSQNAEKAENRTNKNTATSAGEVKYSIKYPTYSQFEIENNVVELAKMNAVVEIHEDKLKKTGLKPSEIFEEFFKSLNFNIYSDEFGDIALKKSSVKSEIRHGVTSEKIASIEAIPSVIEKGKVIFFETKKDSDVNRIVVAAPITIGNTPYYMGVMLQRDTQNQRLYLHNVVIEKEISTNSQADLLTTGALENNEHLFITTILQKALVVKNKYMQKREKDTTKYSFAGGNALTAEKSLLAEAMELEKNGVDSEEIRQPTGWFRGYDNKWRFEIDDSKAVFSRHGDIKLQNNKNYPRLVELSERYDNLNSEEKYELETLEKELENDIWDEKFELQDYLYHAELYDAYPQLRHYGFILDSSLSGNRKGFFDKRTNTIHVNAHLNDAEIKSTLFHELQHAIQYIEGFSKGANIDYWEDALMYDSFAGLTNAQKSKFKQLQQQYHDIEDSQPEFVKEMKKLILMKPSVKRGAIDFETLTKLEEDPPEWKQFDAERKRLEDKYGAKAVFDFMGLDYNIKNLFESGRSAKEMYYDTAGEVEARDVANRLTFDEKGRKHTRPDIDREDVVFADDAGVSYSFEESDIEFIEDEVVSEQKSIQQTNENEMTEVIYNLIKIEKPSQKAIYEVSQKILSNTASRMSAKEFAGKLSQLLDYIENGEADITSIQNETKELARQVISRSDYTDNTAWEQYKDVRKQILRKTFYVNRADIGAEDIKQAALLAGRRFYITTDATRRGDIVLDIDEIYEDLHNNNPEFFPETNSPMRQIENISVFLSATSKRVDNPYASGEMGMSEDFAADILAGEIYHTVVTGIIDRSNGIRTVDITKAKDAASRYYKGIEQLKRQAARYSKDYEKFAREQKNKTIAYRELARKEVADKKAEIKSGAERRQLISSLKRLYKDSVNLLLGKRNDRLGTPQELKSALFDVVELVNLQNGMYPGNKYNDRILSMRTRIHNMRETLVNYKKETDAEGNESVSEYAVDVLDALRTSTQDGKKTIDLLSNDELRNLVNVLQHVKGLVTDANKMFTENLNADYDKLGNAVINELRDKRNHLGGTNSLKTLMTTNQLMPEYFFERIGGTLENLFRNIYNTEGEQFRILQRFVADASAIAQKHKFNEWGLKETKFEYKTSRGEIINIDLFNVMTLYALYKRERSNFGTISETMHILHGGEIEFTEDLGAWKEAMNNGAAFVRNHNSKIKKVQKIQEELADEGKGDSPTKSYFLSEQDVKNLIGMLGDNQKAFADSMIRYLSNDVAAVGNEASRKMFNHDIFLEKCYFPMSVNKTHLATNIDANEEPKQVQNAPMTKHVSTFADTAIVVRSFMDVWIEHVNQMSVYAATAPALKDFMRVYNYKTKPPVENKTGNVAVDESERQNTKAYSVKALIKEKFGADYTEYIEELMRDLNGGYRTVNEFGPLINATKKTAVALSLSCAIQQPAAMARAFSILDVKNFANYSKKGYDEMMKYSAIAQIKSTNGYDTLSGPSLLYEIVNHNNDEKFAQTKMFLECIQKHNWKMASQFTDEFLFYLPKKMDEITWTSIWNSCKKQVRKEGKFKTENEAFFKAVTEVFENVVRRTQVYDSTFQKSGNLRSKSQLVNMEMAFMTEPTISWNMLLNAKQKLQSGDKKTATRIVTSVAASSICAIILKSFIGALRKVEKDDDAEDFLLSWFDLSTQNGVSELFGFLPIIKDIYSIFDGYSIERMEFANIERIINAFKALDSEEKSMSEKITDVGAALANVFGVPGTTIVRGIRSSINVAHNILHIADEPYTKAMLEATKNGDNLIIAQIYDEQIANGLTKATILKQYRQAMAENIPEITEAIQLLSRGDETAYYKKCREIIDMGFDYSDIKASINLLLDEKEAKQNASLLAKAKTWVKSSFDFDYVAADIEVPDEYYNSTFSEMVEAVQDGDTSGFTKMYNQLLSDGYTEAQVKSNYREAIANEIPEIVTAAEYLQNGEAGKYSITIGKIAESGFALADVQSAVNKYISSNSVGLTDSEKFAGSRISDIGTDIAGDVAVIAEEELFSGAIYNYDMLYATMIEQGSNGTDYKKMYNYLLDNGTSKKSIDNAMENRVEKTVKKWINAQNSGEYAIYESCLKELTAYYGNRDKAVKAVNKYRAEQNKLIKNYINAHSESKKTEAKEALIKEFGDWDTASKAIEYYKK